MILLANGVSYTDENDYHISVFPWKKKTIRRFKKPYLDIQNVHTVLIDDIAVNSMCFKTMHCGTIP